jgi:hypothetical protein
VRTGDVERWHTCWLNRPSHALPEKQACLTPLLLLLLLWCAGEISSRLSADTTTVSDSITLNLNILVRTMTQVRLESIAAGNKQHIKFLQHTKL